MNYDDSLFVIHIYTLAKWFSFTVVYYVEVLSTPHLTPPKKGGVALAHEPDDLLLV